MNESHPHTNRLQLWVIASFFLGLLVMAGVAIALGWLIEMQISWLSLRLGWPNQILGPLLTLGGLALVGWSVRLQYVSGQGTPAPLVATQRLVTQGPYACTRNPMTLGALIMYLGIGVWLGSGGVVLLTVMVFSLLLRYIQAHETRELAQRFGQAYLDYKKRTPFLIPRCPRLA